MPKKKGADGNPHLAALRKRVAKAPANPGVYHWMDKHGKVLYIGKAKNLRNRLKSYVQEPDAAMGPWKLAMQKQLADFDVTVTNTELEALVLETNLIKEGKPKYNVLMKDDKSYVYVQISKDPYPVIEIVRKGIAQGMRGFGPYTSTHDIRKTMDMLHVIFPYKGCKKSLEKLNKPHSEGIGDNPAPCLEYQIGRCCGTCIGAVTCEEYNRMIEQVVRFLKGDRKEAVQRLHEKMKEAALAKKFEAAAELRDVLQAIDRMEERQLVSDTSGQDIDFIGISVLKERTQVVIFRQRNGKVIDEVSLTLSGAAESAADALTQFLPQYYDDTPDIPDIIVIGEELEEADVLREWLRKERGKKVELRVAERGKKSHLLALAEKNAAEKLKAQETKWEAAAKNTEEALKELQKILSLPSPPKRIEGYDISHLSGTETVGSMAVAKNGKAANDQYRSFTIRTVKEGDVDDYKALEEVLRRRLLHLVHNVKEEEKEWKEKGFTFGKVRKAEQKIIDKIHEENYQEINNKEIKYENYLVARKDNEIVGFCRIVEHDGGHKELKSLWVYKEERHLGLGSFLVRKMIGMQKKLKKIYITAATSPEEFYGTLGFRYVENPPEIIEKKLRIAEKEKHVPPGIVMVYIYADHKTDSSLSAQPELLVVDGGKGQLGSAVKVLKELDLEIPVIGLAKREEEIFIPCHTEHSRSVTYKIVPFPKDSQAKFLLMRIRNEAHRFANHLREKKGAKAAVASALDEIPGIGEKTKKELLLKFGSVAGIKAASDEDLSAILSASQLKALRQR